MRRSEIRESQIRELLDKVRKRNYGSYLLSLLLKRIRHLQGPSISFDFPVTALVGANGSGKSTVLGAAACVYSAGNARDFFFTSVVGDQQVFSWEFEFDLIDKQLSPRNQVNGKVSVDRNGASRSPIASRPLQYFGVHRTLPPINSPLYMRRHLSGRGNSARTHKEEGTELVRAEASKVLGKDLSRFKLLEVSFTTMRKVKIKKGDRTSDTAFQGEPLSKYRKVAKAQRQHLFVYAGLQPYSEFNFGAGEASVLRLIYGIEKLPEQSLVLIEELENGLHPLAVERLVEYLIAAAIRRKLQVIFTTHSDYALGPLPAEGIWSIIRGQLIQGPLSVECLRALSGQIEKRLAIFTEDIFAQRWVEAILREVLGQRFDEVGVYSLGGDGAAVKVHLAHNQDPSVSFKSICFIDGDSKQVENEQRHIYRLPGQCPELAVFDGVKATLEKNAAVLTAGCQRSLSSQQIIVDAVKEIASTNRDPHLLFSQIGGLIGLVSEEIVRGAFFTVWIQENQTELKRITDIVLSSL